MKTANDDSDHYVIWSTNVDSPVFDGTWAEVEEYETERELKRFRQELAKDRIAVDETGTSVRHSYGGEIPGSWHDEDLAVMECPWGENRENWQSGTLRRSDLAEWLRTESNEFITPFEFEGD